MLPLVRHTNSALRVRSRGYLIRPNGLEDQQHEAGGDADVGYIEDAGAEETNANVHEVDNTSLVKQAIQEIAYASTKHEAPGNGCGQWQLLNKENAVRATSRTAVRPIGLCAAGQPRVSPFVS